MEIAITQEGKIYSRHVISLTVFDIEPKRIFPVRVSLARGRAQTDIFRDSDILFYDRWGTKGTQK